jgi:CheY-like chemotaxis protein
MLRLLSMKERHSYMNGSLRVLAVEDDKDVAELYEAILGGFGHKVLVAHNGREAVRLMQEHPDVVILDLRLPDTDGYTLLRRIRAHPDLKDSTVIVISATIPHDRRSIAGADEVLAKPFDLDELVQAIERAEGRRLH